MRVPGWLLLRILKLWAALPPSSADFKPASAAQEQRDSREHVSVLSPHQKLRITVLGTRRCEGEHTLNAQEAVLIRSKRNLKHLFSVEGSLVLSARHCHAFME